MYCSHDLHFKAFSLFSNYQGTKQVVILTWQTIFWTLFQKADSKQAVLQLNQSIAVTQQMLQACLQHRPVPLQHHEEETEYQHIVGNSTTFCEQSCFIYIWSFVLNPAGQKQTNECWIIHCRSVLEMSLSTVIQNCVHEQTITPGPQADFRLGVHHLCTAEASSQTERLGFLFKALRKGFMK